MEHAPLSQPIWLDGHGNLERPSEFKSPMEFVESTSLKYLIRNNKRVADRKHGFESRWPVVGHFELAGEAVA